MSNIIFLQSYLYLCFGDKLLNDSLCLLRLMQLRKASIILCDQRDMLKWDHMLILGFREMGSVFASVPRLFQYTRKHDLFLKNSTWSKILLFAHRLNPAFIQDFAIWPPYSAILLNTFKDFTIYTLSKALLRSQTHQRHRDFSQVRKPVRLTCPEILQKCEIDIEGTTEVHFTQLLWLRTPELPCPQCVGRQDLCLIHFLSAMRLRRILPQVLQNMPSFW